jgi:hypothetical protein
LSFRTSKKALLEESLEFGFAKFWVAYPKKQGKRDALRAWTKLQPDGPLQEKILFAIVAQARSKQWQEGYIPLPATWLRGERWDDEVGSSYNSAPSVVRRVEKAWSMPEKPETNPEEVKKLIRGVTSKIGGGNDNA